MTGSANADEFVNARGIALSTTKNSSAGVVAARAALYRERTAHGGAATAIVVRAYFGCCTTRK